MKEAVNALKAGKVLLYPTDTVPGLGCDATNKEAIERIRTLKKRPDNMPMVALVNSIAMLERYFSHIPDIAYDLLEETTTPLTLILSEAKFLPKSILGKDDDSLAVRITEKGPCAELIKRFGRAIISTSANTHGVPAPATMEEVEERIKNAVDLIMDDDTLYDGTGSPSSIIKVKPNGEVKIIRE